MNWLLVLVLAAMSMLAGCSGYYDPVALPAHVHLSPDLTADDKAAARAATVEWHAALGTTVVVSIDEATSGCGIFIRYERGDDNFPPERGGFAQVTDECVGTIIIRPGLVPAMAERILTHELGHLFRGDIEHSDDPFSVMFPKANLGRAQFITDTDVAAVAKRLR